MQVLVVLLAGGCADQEHFIVPDLEQPREAAQHVGVALVQVRRVVRRLAARAEEQPHDVVAHADEPLDARERLRVARVDGACRAVQVHAGGNRQSSESLRVDLV